jgi:hypothetical protein
MNVQELTDSLIGFFDFVKKGWAEAEKRFQGFLIRIFGS